MEPISTALSAGNAAKTLLGGMVDRWRAAAQSSMDIDAMLRLLVLEVRRNLAILDVAVGHKAPLPPAELWLVPTLLQTEMIEAILGRGAAQTGAFRVLSKVSLPSDSEDDAGGAGTLATLYVRITTLQSLAVLERQASLSRIKIQLRLANLRTALRVTLNVLENSTIAKKAAV
jgi:hypothetical protein